MFSETCSLLDLLGDGSQHPGQHRSRTAQWMAILDPGWLGYWYPSYRRMRTSEASLLSSALDLVIKLHTRCISALPNRLRRGCRWEAVPARAYETVDERPALPEYHPALDRGENDVNRFHLNTQSSKMPYRKIQSGTVASFDVHFFFRSECRMLMNKDFAPSNNTKPNKHFFV